MVLPHYISWKGRGFAVPLLTILWFTLSVGALIVIDGVYPNAIYTPDKAKAAAMATRLVAAAFGLSAINVLLYSARRDRQRRKPGANLPPDEFMYVPLKFWPYVLAVCSLGTFVWSFFTN